MAIRLTGLVAATHTPFDKDGRLNLAAVERQAEHLDRNGVKTAFIGGSTGESHSLAVDERLALARRWSEVVHRSTMQLVVHVGSNCLADARTLVAQARELRADAIAALAPSYFKPKSLDSLIACCGEIAAAAPGTPFYFYDIRALTGVQFSMPQFLAAADRIPTLAGIKFTNPDLMAFQTCLHAQGRRFDIPWGVDEYLLAALALGASGGRLEKTIADNRMKDAVRQNGVASQGRQRSRPRTSFLPSLAKTVSRRDNILCSSRWTRLERSRSCPVTVCTRPMRSSTRPPDTSCTSVRFLREP